MANPISLFSPYAQKEDRVSNYCGLLMKLVYEESPLLFQSLLNGLLGENEATTVGPIFTQQEGVGSSRPDLLITQHPIRIAFETKNYDWFYDDQLERHLDGLADYRNAVLVLLANFETANYEDRFANAIEAARERSVTLVPCSFEYFLSLFEPLDLPPRLRATVDEFASFLSAKGLLPDWKYRLDVVSCAYTMDEIDAGAYMCPDTGGAYSHKRARWLGTYAGNKTVTRIYEVRAVVAVTKDTEELRWNNTYAKQAVVLRQARQLAADVMESRALQRDGTGIQVFLLGARADTEFRKGSPRGLQGSKTYFHGVAREDDTAESLAGRLRGKVWQDVRGRLPDQHEL